MDWLKERLKEKSTYIGLFMVFSAFFGIHLTPEQQNALIFLGMALSGAGWAITKEQKNDD